MSRAHDNEEPLFFQFDSYEDSSSVGSASPQNSSNFLEFDLPMTAFTVSLNGPDFSLYPGSSTPAECGQLESQQGLHDETDEDVSVSIGKGKGVSIPSRDVLDHPAAFDSFPASFFEIGIAIASDDGNFPSTSSTPLTPSSGGYTSRSFGDPIWHSDSTATIYSTDHVTLTDVPTSADGASLMHTVKGKARELPPSLPPLSFSPSEFARGETEWPSIASSSPDGTPCSFGSGSGATSSLEFSSPPSGSAFGGPSATDVPSSPILSRMPSRHRSLSNLSIHSSRSLAAHSMSQVKVKLGRTKRPGNLARIILFRKAEEPSASYPDSLIGAQPSSWPGNEHRLRVPDFPNPRLGLDLESGPSPAASQFSPVGRVARRDKARSYSSPLPASALDLIPTSATDTLVPIPLVLRNHFDTLLPHELKLLALSWLVTLHEREHARAISESNWTALGASRSKGRWVGRDCGIKELIRLSRVSKTWQSLALDGRLWANLEFRSFPKLPTSLFVRITEFAGPFVKGVDLQSHARLPPWALLASVNSLSLPLAASLGASVTQLTTVNLRGCTALSTQSIHHLLMCSPLLETLSLRGLLAVTNATCDILAEFCPRLVSLDLGRCLHMDAEGIMSITKAAQNRQEPLGLRQLRISGLKRINDEVMAALGKAAPFLEVLDLNGANELHNSALDAFVSCTVDETGDFETVLLTPREAGRDPNDTTRFRRRVTRLRHLSMSFCPLLTDHACADLAYAVPRLEFFEMAGIGSELKDEGLVRMLNTTPLIRRLDLEEACDITDAVIHALTPVPDIETRGARTALIPPPPQPGQALEYLAISYAVSVSNDALQALIRNCEHLRSLIVDNTRVSGVSVKEFVRTVRRRQTADAELVAVDCRGVGESVVKDVSSSIRPRMGWRSWDARKLEYLDGRDDEGLPVGQDECDEKRVVLKTFYSWQTVDAVRAAREKRNKGSPRSRRQGSGSSSSGYDEMSEAGASSRRTRWWAPGSRRTSGTNSPTLIDTNNERDGCVIM